MSTYSSSLYGPKDWAVLFSLCAEVQSLGDKESPFYIEPATAVYNWLRQYSIDHDLPEPTGEDVHATIEEALMFLNKFAENHHDDFENRKESNEAG